MQRQHALTLAFWVDRLNRHEKPRAGCGKINPKVPPEGSRQTRNSFTASGFSPLFHSHNKMEANSEF
jgi:hypothetical protein